MVSHQGKMGLFEKGADLQLDMFKNKLFCTAKSHLNSVVKALHCGISGVGMEGRQLNMYFIFFMLFQ